MNLDFLKGIVPCGTSYSGHACTTCDFFSLLQNIINFLLFVLAPLATLVAIYIAFLFMFSGGSSAKITDARSKLWLVVLGIFWVLGSWLVLNTALNFVADKSVFPWPWNQISCSVQSSPIAVSPPNNNTALIIDAGDYVDGVDTSAPGYQALDAESFGLEQVSPSPPFSATEIINPAVGEMVKTADTKGVDQNLVKAIIQAESSGKTDAVHIDSDGKASYGLMQVRADTAKLYDVELKGLSDAEIGERLKNPEYNMKIGTAYLQDLGSKYGGDLDKVIAAYNGGPGANGPSRDCPGSLRWQCGWDNQAHTVPNTGYAVTRDYVSKVNSYYSQLGK